MNSKHMIMSLAAVPLSVLTAYGADVFPSVEKAMAGFATNSVSAQERTFRYVLGATKALNAQNVTRVLPALRTAATTLGRVSDYDSACEEGLRNSAETVRAACASALLQSPTSSASPERTLPSLERVLGDVHALTPAHRLDLAKGVAELKLSRFSDAKGAFAILDAALGRNDLGETPASAALMLKADLCVRLGDAAGAGRTFVDVIRRGEPFPAGIARRLIDANPGMEALTNAVAALRERLAAIPLADVADFVAAVERTQPEVVELLNHLGRFDEALGECRVLVLLSTARNYQAAVNLAAASLKRADGNLGRAIAFMDFQKKDVVPKRHNILMDAPVLSDPVRERFRRRLPVGRCSAWTDSLGVSTRLLWLDDPQSSVREAIRAFGLAPFENKPIQACADAVMQPVLTVTRDPASVKGIVDYLMYGPAGRDGTKGTADDLSMPLDGDLAFLKPGPRK